MMLVTAGATDVTTYFHLRLAADGTDATGLTITDIDLQYVRSRTAPAAKVDATALAATDSAHGDNQAIEIDATDQPGVYRVDWPDAAFAAGVDEVILTVKCATVFTESLRVRLMSATRGLAGTALPNAAADAAGGLIISDAGGLDADAQIVTKINAILDDTGTAGVVVASIASGAITAAAIANGAIDAATFAADVDAEILSYLVDDATRIDASALNTATGTTIPAILDDTDLIDDGTSGLAKIATDVAAILVDTSTTLQGELDGIQADTEDIQAKIGTPSDLGSGATLAGNLVDIEGQTDDIASKASQASVDDLPTNAELATALGTADDATLAAIAALNNLSAAQVNAEVDAAIETYHLDHLLAVTYDPASKPGVADALLNELVESDAGVSRFTANALEQAPTGGSAPTAADIADAVWEEAIADHSGTAGSTAEALANASSAGDPWSTSLPGAYNAGEAGFILGTNLNATVSSRATQTSVDDLPTNTELATSQAAADDATLAAIAALNNLSAAQVNAEVDTALADVGLTGTVTGRIDVAVSTRASQASVDDLPTNAELAASQAAADDATLAAIAALNNLSAAQVNAEVDTALADYDGPTHAELVSEINSVQADIAALTIPTAIENADALLGRDMSAVAGAAARSPLNAFRFNRNKFTIVGTTLTVFQEDDVTPAWTATITQTAGDPVSASDPA